MSVKNLTGKPSVDKPWLKYYPGFFLKKIKVPACSLTQYLQKNMPGHQVSAIHYYGAEITWAQIFAESTRIAKALKAAGCGEADQIPVFLRSVPEFVSTLIAVERIGASLLIRDNEPYENAEAIRKAGAKILIAHDFLSQAEMKTYISETDLERIVVLNPLRSCSRWDMPDYIRESFYSLYDHECAHGDFVISWDEFLEMGKGVNDVDAPIDIDRPLFRCYTSGSTGPSKQVIHSARTIIGVLSQMNFYGGKTSKRPTWMVTILPPALVAVVVSMILLPLVSNKLLILNPWVAPEDLDLECMRYKPNNWPMIPMFLEILMNSKRIPEDYDISHLTAIGAGAEACNNTQIQRVQEFLAKHNSKLPFTTGYGSSEAGSNLTFHVSGRSAGNCNMGCPMPLTTVTICKPGTTQELPYGQSGEICVSGPGVMMGYDTKEATDKALKVHEDGNTWLHMGDMGYMDEEGHVFVLGRGSNNKRYGGGYVDILPMENLLADAKIPGIEDQFFVNNPNIDHPGYLVPYLYVVLKDGYTVDSIRDAVQQVMPEHMVPAQIIQVPTRPYWHFKTNRIGLTQPAHDNRAV